MAAEADKPQVLIIAGAVATIVALVVAIIIGISIYFQFSVRAEIQRKVTGVPNEALIALHKEEAHKLSTYQWVEKGKVVRIPLDQAIKLTLRDWPSRSDAPVPIPAAAAPAGAAPAAAAPAVNPAAPAARPGEKPAAKSEKPSAGKPDQKADQKAAKKPAQKPAKKADQKPAQKTDKKPEGAAKAHG